MKKVILFLTLASVIQLHGALSNAIYLKSAITDKNEALAQAIISILPDNQKAGATKLFRDAFGKDPIAPAGGLTKEQRDALIKQASNELQQVLQGKDLNNPDQLKEVLAFIGSDKGSGGKLAKQVGPQATATLTDALQKSAQK